MNKLWKVWQYSLGGYDDETTKPYDHYITIVRTIIVGVNFVTCFFIMANAIHHW